MKRVVRAALAVLLAVSFVAAVPAVAAAESTATSTITQIKVVDKGDKNYRLLHGAIWLDYNKSSENYRWGGAHCGGAGLSEINVSLLFAAFRSKYSVTLEYKRSSYKNQTYNCITGFTVTRS